MFCHYNHNDCIECDSSSVSMRLNDILKYEDGWLDGEGSAFKKEDLAYVDEWMMEFLKKSHAKVPSIYPASHTGIICALGTPSLDVIFYFDFPKKRIIFHATDRWRDPTTREEIVRFDDPDGPDRGASFLMECF